MLLIALLVVAGFVLGWKPLRAPIPSESLAAVGAVAVVLFALLSLGGLG